VCPLWSRIAETLPYRRQILNNHSDVLLLLLLLNINDYKYYILAIVGDEKKNDNLVLITSTTSSSIPFVKLPAEEDNIINSNLPYNSNIDGLKNVNDGN